MTVKSIPSVEFLEIGQWVRVTLNSGQVVEGGFAGYRIWCGAGTVVVRGVVRKTPATNMIKASAITLLEVRG